MFMTLKSSGKTDNGLKEIFTAQGDNIVRKRDGHVGSSRRVACARCRSKKLRCTGDIKRCDRCIAQRAPCASPRVHDRRKLKRDGCGQSAPELPSADGGNDGALDLDFDYVEVRLKTPETLSGSPPAISPAPSASWLPPDCTCQEDIVDIIQKLDDDEFRLRELTFDQVLKVQKWMIFHCVQVVGCQHCNSHSMAHSLLLMLSGRLMKIFECLSQRLRQHDYNVAVFSSTMTSDSQASPQIQRRPAIPATPDSLPSLSWTGSNDLFAMSPPPPSGAACCNPDMFSADFKQQYSADEQFHMIRVLAKVQMNNFRQLLGKIEDLPFSRSSGLKLKNIGNLLARAKATADRIDSSFEKMLQELEM